MPQASRIRFDTRTGGIALAAAFLLASCGGTDSNRPPPQVPPVISWTSLGEIPAHASTTGDHTPLVVSMGEVFVGTEDGVWRRAIAGEDTWKRLGPDGLSVFALRVDPQNENTLFAAGAPHRFDQPTFYSSADRGGHWTPSQAWFIPPRPQESSPIYGLAILPDDSRFMWGTLAGDRVFSSDGGVTWALPDGRSEEFFGYPCILFITPTRPRYFVSGCEQPLDIAYLGSVEIDPADPFSRETGPGPWRVDFNVLANRRPNAFAWSAARPDTLYAGVEGALLAVTPDHVQWVFSGGTGTPWPYAYISAIWVDPEDPYHLVFGGSPNGIDARLSLFETRDHGITLRMLDPPRQFTGPGVVQIAPSGRGDLIVLISDGDGLSAAPHRLFAYRLATGVNAGAAE